MTRSLGIALVAVLWGIVLLSVLAAGVVALTLAGSREATLAESRARARDATEAAIIGVVTRLSRAGTSRAAVLGGAAVEMDHEDVHATVHVTFESGRIDLNAANDTLLIALAESAGLSHRESEQWVAKLRDWQDPDDARRFDGAEAADYHAAGRPYGPRNGPLKSISELRLVLGMTDELYACLEPAVTIYTQSALPDPGRLTPRSRLAWRRYESDQSLAPQEPSSSSSADGDPAGQILRFTLTVSRKDTRSSTEIVVGRLTGDPKRPWIALGRWRPEVLAECTA